MSETGEDVETSSIPCGATVEKYRKIKEEGKLICEEEQAKKCSAA
jgi:hypothetical protein